jgi:hypothetical protein
MHCCHSCRLLFNQVRFVGLALIATSAAIASSALDEPKTEDLERY